MMNKLFKIQNTSSTKRSSWMFWIGFLVIASTGLVSCSSRAVAPLEVIDTWKPPEGSDAAPPLSCEEIGDLFAYNAQAPLDIQEMSHRREEGVTVIDLTYASPMGGRVPATLVLPDGPGQFAGMLYQHGMPSTRQPLIPGAVTYARMGAVVLLIDAPFARPEHGDTEALTFTERDQAEQIQLIIDLRRGVDLLLSRPEVDPQRLAYVGISYGGAMGGLLAGVEHRLKGYVLQVGDGGLVTHLTGPEDKNFWAAKPLEMRKQWVAWMWPIEPIHYVGCAAPAALLFQNGTLDAMVPPADALRYQKAGSEPKTIRWYKNDHGLGVAAGRDQAEWLSKVIGIDSHRPNPKSVEIILSAWVLMTAGSLVFIVWELWRTRPAPHGARLMWLLTTVFLGPLGLIIYWISARQTPDSGESSNKRSPVRRALGSAAWAASGNVLGGIGVLALLMYYPGIFGAYLVLQIAATFLLPFCAGWLVFAISRRISKSETRYERIFRRPMFAEVVSTCLVLVGLYPTLNILIGRSLNRWTAPFGFDLSYAPLWDALCLGTFAGTLVAYPFHLWMIRRRVIRWGAAEPTEEAAARGLAWYQQAALVVLSFAAMLAAIFLSMQIA
jgi:uncharacterized protein